MWKTCWERSTFIDSIILFLFFAPEHSGVSPDGQWLRTPFGKNARTITHLDITRKRNQNTVKNSQENTRKRKSTKNGKNTTTNDEKHRILGKKQLKLEHFSKAEIQIMHRKNAFSIRQRYYRLYQQGHARGNQEVTRPQSGFWCCSGSLE